MRQMLSLMNETDCKSWTFHRQLNRSQDGAGSLPVKDTLWSDRAHCPRMDRAQGWAQARKVGTGFRSGLRQDEGAQGTGRLSR